MATMTVRSTKVTEQPQGFAVELTLSNDAELETASGLLHLRVSVDIGEQYPRLARLQQAALADARLAIDAEIDRLSQLLRQLPA